MSRSKIFRYYEIDFLKMLTDTCTDVGITGGYFDPIHAGHINLIEEAKENCKFLVVCVNNDIATYRKKGYVLLPIDSRLRVIAQLPEVSVVLEVNDTEMTGVLQTIKPSVYLKGGDRDEQNMLQKEIDVCASIGCEIKYGMGGYKKLGSSSVFFQEAMKQYNESIHTKQKQGISITPINRVHKRKLPKP